MPTYPRRLPVTHQRRLNGLCTRCGNEPPARAGSSWCAACCSTQRDKQRAARGLPPSSEIVVTQEKACSRCDCVKPLADFYTSNGSPTSACRRCILDRKAPKLPALLPHTCAKCGREALRKRGSNRRPALYCDDCRLRLDRAKLTYKNAHGMTAIQKRMRLDQQLWRCELCSDDIPTASHAAVDHDHACCPAVNSCGACVRGLLCSLCNSALGMARDSPELLRRLADYLERPTSPSQEMLSSNS